jgi:hypothetical protein
VVYSGAVMLGFECQLSTWASSSLQLCCQLNCACLCFSAMCNSAGTHWRKGLGGIMKWQEGVGWNRTTPATETQWATAAGNQQSQKRCETN